MYVCTERMVAGRGSACLSLERGDRRERVRWMDQSREESVLVHSILAMENDGELSVDAVIL